MYRFLLILLLTISNSQVHAFGGGFDTVEMLKKLDAMYTKMNEQFKEMRRQRMIAENLKQIEDLRDVSFQDVRSGRLSRILRSVESGTKGLKNPFGREIKDLIALKDHLHKMLGLAETEEDRQHIQEQIRAVEGLEQLELVEQATLENFKTSTVDNSERVGANITANNTSTLTLIAIDEHKERQRRRRVEADLAKNARDTITELQPRVFSKGDKN